MFLSHLSISDLPSVEFDGVYRVLGCLPSTEFYGFTNFADTFSTLPQSEWQELDLEGFNLPILDQGATSSCVGHASCSAMEMAWVQSGRKFVDFSPYFIYGQVNGGMDRGARISDALNALKQIGTCKKSEIPNGAMFRYQFPQTAYTSAGNYKIFDAFRCPTFDEICSAISLGFPTVLGIWVGNNFPRLDSEGVAPLPAGGGGGHALLGMGLKKSQKYGWVIKIQNSWGGTFGSAMGMKGHCYLRREHFDNQVDSFAIQVIADVINDPNDPPVAHD